MVRFGARAQFQHVAEHRDAASARPDLDRRQRGQRGPHRGRVGVVALVDEEGLAVPHSKGRPLAAPDRRAQRRERQGGAGQIRAEAVDHRHDAERVHRRVAAGGAELVGHRLAHHHGVHHREVGAQHDPAGAHIRLGVLAEGDDAASLRGAAHGRAAGQSSDCRG